MMLGFPIRITITGTRTIGKSTILEICKKAIEAEGLRVHTIPSDGVNEFMVCESPLGSK